jgi:hypothetical protein
MVLAAMSSNLARASAAVSPTAVQAGFHNLAAKSAVCFRHHNSCGDAIASEGVQHR